MAKYRCKICGYIYDEEKEGRPVTDIDYCPRCKMDQTYFVLVEDEEESE